MFEWFKSEISDKIFDMIWEDDAANHLTPADCVKMFVENCVKYSMEHNTSKTNWTARDLFNGILSENEISELFDEK